MENKIFKAALLTLLLVSYGFSLKAQLSPGSQNLSLGVHSITPAPVFEGKPVTMCFNFGAAKGATLNLAAGEEISFNMDFVRVKPGTLGSAIPRVDYTNGSTGYMTWTYPNLPALPDTWIGKIRTNLAEGTYATVCFDNVIADRATQAQADAMDGVGFSVELSTHSYDNRTEDDLDERYMFSRPPYDLTVTKTPTTSTATIGQTISFTVTATNNGSGRPEEPSHARGVKVTEQWPSGLTFVSSSLPGDYDPSTGIWDVGNVQDGASKTLTLTGVVNSTGTHTNVVTISADELPINEETNPNNNTSQATVTVITQSPCVTILSSDLMTASNTGNNTSAGYTTVYVLTNNTGIIQNSGANASFSVPSSATNGQEFRIYAVNYNGTAPNLSNGTNINSVETSATCVDLSSNYKCFTVNIPNCPPPTVSIQTGSPATICSGENTSIVAQGCTGTVSWYANGVQTNQTGNTISVTPSTNTIYTATCTATGCGTTAQSTQGASVTVTQPVSPTVVTPNVSVSYSQASTTLNANCSNNTYVWRNAAGQQISTSANPSVTVSPGSTAYTVACGEGSCFTPVTVTVFKCGNPADNCLRATIRRM